MNIETILVDGIKDVVLHNGLVRVDCVSAGPNGIQRDSGSLLIPANVAGPFVQELANAVSELDRKMREERDAQAAPLGSGQ